MGWGGEGLVHVLTVSDMVGGGGGAPILFFCVCNISLIFLQPSSARVDLMFFASGSN